MKRERSSVSSRTGVSRLRIVVPEFNSALVDAEMFLSHARGAMGGENLADAKEYLKRALAIVKRSVRTLETAGITVGAHEGKDCL